MQSDEFFQLLCQTFTELGATDPQAIYRTLLLRDRRFVGHCYHCGDYRALWAPGSAAIEFYRHGGELLRTVPWNPAEQPTVARAISLNQGSEQTAHSFPSASAG
jgi:hypothetical protein